MSLPFVLYSNEIYVIPLGEHLFMVVCLQVNEHLLLPSRNHSATLCALQQKKPSPQAEFPPFPHDFVCRRSAAALFPRMAFAWKLITIVTYALTLGLFPRSRTSKRTLDGLLSRCKRKEMAPPIDESQKCLKYVQTLRKYTFFHSRKYTKWKCSPQHAC